MSEIKVLREHWTKIELIARRKKKKEKQIRTNVNRAKTRVSRSTFREITGKILAYLATIAMDQDFSTLTHGTTTAVKCIRNFDKSCNSRCESTTWTRWRSLAYVARVLPNEYKVNFPEFYVLIFVKFIARSILTNRYKIDIKKERKLQESCFLSIKKIIYSFGNSNLHIFSKN